MRLPRMTVRRWLVVVAAIALGLEAVRLSRVRDHHLRMAAHNARWEAIHLESERGREARLAAELRAWLESGAATAEPEIARARQHVEGGPRMSAIFAERRRISERLASHPWESAPPDPLDRKPAPEPPLLIFEPSPGQVYAFTPRSVVPLALAPVAALLGYAAFRLVGRWPGRGRSEWAAVEGDLRA